MYIVQEIQTTNGSTTLVTPVQKATREEAESAFYVACGAAAISQVETHTVMVYTEEGFAIPELCKAFRHGDSAETVNYITQEIQTNSDVTSLLTPVVSATPNAAESEFYIKLGYAAISQVETHALMLFNSRGEVLLNGCYKHA